MSSKFLAKVLNTIAPNASWSNTGTNYDTIEWHWDHVPKPSAELVAAEIAKLQAAEDATAYQRTRAEQYPAIADQLDMLWHAMDTGALPKVDSFYSAIKAVKDANPKP
jgi:hypothetical protein